MSHSFLKESKLYIVYSGAQHRIYTDTALNFSQSFTEDSYPVKTLHDQSKMIEGTTINKANPAQFSFGVPLTVEKKESVVMDLLSDLVATSESDIETQQLKSFDMYIETSSNIFKVADCVISSADFMFSPREQFKVSVEGQGTKLSRVAYYDTTSDPQRWDDVLDNSAYSIPGTPVSEGATRTPLQVYPEVSIDSLNMSSIIGLTVSIQNDIEWTAYTTLNKSLVVTGNSDAMYPTTYTVNNRIVSGEIRQYQTSNNITQSNDFSTNSNITVRGKKMDGTTFWQLQLNPAMYTSRMAVGDVYVQSYDFRSTDNTALSTRITQYS